jgi:hypothetical protein
MLSKVLIYVLVAFLTIFILTKIRPLVDVIWGPLTNIGK